MTETLKPYPDFQGHDDAEQAFMDTHGPTESDFAPNAVSAKEWFSLYEQFKNNGIKQDAV